MPAGQGRAGKRRRIPDPACSPEIVRLPGRCIYRSEDFVHPEDAGRGGCFSQDRLASGVASGGMCQLQGLNGMRARIVVLVCEQAIGGLLETREGEVCGQMKTKDPQRDLAYRKLGLRTDASKREKVLLHCRRSMPWPGDDSYSQERRLSTIRDENLLDRLSYNDNETLNICYLEPRFPLVQNMSRFKHRDANVGSTSNLIAYTCVPAPGVLGSRGRRTRRAWPKETRIVPRLTGPR